MATCDMGYDHEAAALAEPEVVLTSPETNEHDVAIAKAQAAAQVKTEEAYAAGRDAERDAELQVLRARVEAQDAELATLRQPPVVIVAEPEAEPEPEPVVEPANAEPEPPEAPSNPTPRAEKKRGWWDSYR